MRIAEATKKFLESAYQNFDIINAELNIQYKKVHEAIKNNYENLLFSNTGKSELLKKLKPEELFLMNVHDKHILAILNISIYESIINGNYEILYNGIYTYTHLRNLNRLHLSGYKFNVFLEHIIVNENIFKDINNWKEYAAQQFIKNFGEQMTGKFDMELMNLLTKIINGDNKIENHFNNLFAVGFNTPPFRAAQVVCPLPIRR